jgi:protein SCO1/2
MRQSSMVLTVGFFSVLAAGSLVALGGCNSNSEPISSAAILSNRDCLPDLTFIDQDGHRLSLASLKGKPVLFDFIYTTCPGPCLVITSRMRAIADDLGTELGKDVRFVSVTVDPEHDGPSALRAFAKEQGALRPGWLFLTGTPATIDDLMARFKLIRHREADGEVDHVLEFFLVGPGGKPLTQYLASDVRAEKIAGDLTDAAHGKSVAGA